MDIVYRKEDLNEREIADSNRKYKGVVLGPEGWFIPLLPSQLNLPNQVLNHK